MATSIQQRGDKHQLRVVHGLLPKPFFATFGTHVEATNYRDQLTSWLSAGFVPPDLFKSDEEVQTPRLTEVIEAFKKRGSPAPSTVTVLDVVYGEVVGVRVGEVTYLWAEGYVKSLKEREKKLAPGTIRKRVEALGRALDWYFVSEQHKQPKGTPMPVNVLRLLPDGYSLYEGREVVDEQRDLRLAPGDEEKILSALHGVKRDGMQRALEVDPALTMLFELIVDTGLRLREAYWLRVSNLDVARATLNVNGTKGHRGAARPRVVPLKRALREKLGAWCEGKGQDELVFPFWDGTRKDLDLCSHRLSNRFRTLFNYAGVPHFTEHDLRHEACCRWVTLRDAQYRWVFNDTEICKIMGWRDPKMMLRYASLRAEDLSARLL